MATNTSMGNYYKNRTKKYLEARGYTVQLTEFLTTRFIGGGKSFFMKKDVFGADGIAINGEEIIFWNAKSTKIGQTSWSKSTGKSEFRKYPFPLSVKLHLYIWQPRKEPIVVDCRA